MINNELDSFISKFKQLWQAGLDAHLVVESKAGKAWVHLHVPLGEAFGLAHEVPKSKLRNKNSPSRQRRWARREAVRIAEAAKKNESEEVQVIAEGALAEEATISFHENIEHIDDAEEAQNINNDEQLSEEIAVELIAEKNDNEVNIIECCFCDLVCENEIELETHWRESHTDEYKFPDTEESETEESDNEEIKAEYHCENCNYIFKNAGQLRRHRTTKHKWNVAKLLEWRYKARKKMSNGPMVNQLVFSST